MECTYLWVRTDIPLADQIVQAAHAAQAAGSRWGFRPGCTLVLLAARDGDHLRRADEWCADRSVETVGFFEPDASEPDGTPMGLTALCTEPLPREARKLFRRFAIWRA